MGTIQLLIIAIILPEIHRQYCGVFYFYALNTQLILELPHSSKYQVVNKIGGLWNNT